MYAGREGGAQKKANGPKVDLILLFRIGNNLTHPIHLSHPSIHPSIHLIIHLPFRHVGRTLINES
jgi:hypothetical protein